MSVRVAVLSSTEFGRRCIEEAIMETPACTLGGILTTEEAIPISYAPAPIRIATHARFDDLARRAGCPLATLPGRPTTAMYLDVLSRWRAALVLVLGWYYLVPRAVRETAPLGCLGIHASLLPKYRGGAPISWALINGETRTGVTLFHLADDVDAGDIVAQRPVSIGPFDTCADLIAATTKESIEMLRETLPLIASGVAPRRPQDHALATVVPQRAAADGLIDWSRGVGAVHNFVRAQTRPYPGAFTWVNDTRITIWSAAPASRHSGSRPGTVRVAPDEPVVLVACGDGELRVDEIGLSDGRTLRGRALVETMSAPGVILGSPA